MIKKDIQVAYMEENSTLTGTEVQLLNKDNKKYVGYQLFL